MSLIAGAAGGSGLTVIWIGILKERWIESVKAVYAKELEDFRSTIASEQKHIQASIDRSIFVTRAQFDTEFNAMKDIFRYATLTLLELEQTRPMLTFRPDGETKGERINDLQLQGRSLIKAFNEFSSQLEILSPFYPPELYERLLICRNAASQECGQISYGGDESLSTEGFRKADENRRQFSAAYREAATLIRERLTKLSVIA